ncbi:MAG: dihydrofolate reductase [Clostridia bacterium]|nr:dihydrofolate reductase [Clostridia bacterium]
MIAAVAAVDRDYAIGYGGDMLIHLPGDLKMFRELTSGHTVIMGRKTFDALPCGALPNRRNIVISSRAEGEIFPVCDEKGEYVLSSMEKVKGMLEKNTDETLFVIGGGVIYKELLPYCQRIYLTHIDKVFGQADTYFPQTDGFVLKNCSETMEEKGVKYRFCIYERA